MKHVNIFMNVRKIIVKVRNSRNKNRKSKFNCTLRKALLMTDGYKVIYGYSNNEVKEKK